MYRRILTLAALLTLLMSMQVLLTRIQFVHAEGTTVKVCPQSITLGPDKVVDAEVLVGVCVENVEDLYGFDIRLSWDTTYFAYLNHTVTVPWDATPTPVPPCNYAGLLYAPVFPVKDEVNATAGTYTLAYASMAPAPAFNGSGTAFTMWFRVIKQPYDYEGTATFNLTLYLTKLSDKAGVAIPHTKAHAQVTIRPFIHSKVHPIRVNTDVYEVFTKSNGTVSDIDYSRLLTDKFITFNVSGPSGMVGYVNITIPKRLMWAEPGEHWQIYRDATSIPPEEIQIAENTTHTSLYFTFTYPSEVAIKIISPHVIPEFSQMMLLITLVVTAAVVTLTRKVKKTSDTLHFSHVNF